MSTALPGPLLFLILSQAHPANAVVNYTANYTAKVLDFSYQSQGILFADWISLLTLCLAPLIAHIVSGAPRPVYLSQIRPRWHDRICIHNPTTILWRYFAIADRRIRAKAWGPADMAASNAYFWTTRGWDGSEEMVDRSRAHCVKLPDHARTELVSETSAKSVIVTFQGVQALYTMTSGIASKTFAGTIAIDTIFFPLAVFGLLRVWATFWLTEDYSYAAENDGFALMTTGSSKIDLSTSGSTSQLEAQPMASIGLLGMRTSTSAPERRFHSTNSWRGWVFRILYILPIFGLWVLCVIYLLPFSNNDSFTTTTLLLVAFYLFFLSASLVIYTFYFVRGRSSSTIIPCMTSLWYKIYTAILMLFLLVLIVVAALESRRTSCGRYTTWPLGWDIDSSLCTKLIPRQFKADYTVANATAGNSAPFGIALWSVDNINGTTPKEREFVVVGFDGWCQGNAHLSEPQVVRRLR